MEDKYLEKFVDVLCKVTYWNREDKKELISYGKILKIENEFISFMIYQISNDFIIGDIDKSGDIELDIISYDNKKFIVTGLKKIFKNDLREINLLVSPKK